MEGVGNPKAAEPAFPRRDRTERCSARTAQAAPRGTQLPLLLLGLRRQQKWDSGEKPENEEKVWKRGWFHQEQADKSHFIHQGGKSSL